MNRDLRAEAREWNKQHEQLLREASALASKARLDAERKTLLADRLKKLGAKIFYAFVASIIGWSIISTTTIIFSWR